MVIRYRRYIQNSGLPCPPPVHRVTSIPCHFVPSRVLTTRPSWARPFIVYTLPCLGSF